MRAAGDYNGISSRLAYELQLPFPLAPAALDGYTGRGEVRQYGWQRSHAGKAYLGCA